MGAQLDWAIGQLEILDRTTDVPDSKAEHPPRHLVGHHHRARVVQDDLGGVDDVECGLPEIVTHALRGTVAGFAGHHPDTVATVLGERLCETGVA